MSYYFSFFFLIVILLVLGLPYNKTSITDIINKETAQVVRENFKSSSKQDIKNGASTFYDWSRVKSCHKKKDDDNSSCSTEIQEGDFIENKFYIQPVEKQEIIREKADCNTCDITKMKGIDKYVLKSSVPACPDMSKYAPKSMVKSCPDMKDYIKKSEIPPCPQCPNLNDYVLKSQVPAQVECPVCPVCPICPPTYKKIEEDPKFREQIKIYEKNVNKKIEEKYITKEQCKIISNQSFYDGVEHGNKKGIVIGESKGFEKGWEKYHDKINQSKTEPLDEIKNIANTIKNMLTTPPVTTPPLTTPPVEEEYYMTTPPMTTQPVLTTPPTEEEQHRMNNEFHITNPYKNPNKNVSCDSPVYTFENNIPGSTNEK